MLCVLWVRGKAAGRESALDVIEQVSRSGKIPFEALHGAFVLAIRWPDSRTFVFTDNSGMHTIAVSEAAISTSFLHLVRFMRENRFPNLGH